MMFQRFAGLSRIHFVGIGGAGMSGIAEVLLDYDLEISGCDQALGEATERLAGRGARVFAGHSVDHLEGVDLVVKSSAVPDTNPEIRAARERGITVARRAEMLGELMRLKYGIAVAGTHGKTTTTSMVGALLVDAGLDPTVIVGGRLRVTGTGARLGKSDFLVAEADEFDRSFLRLAPIIAVVTSIDVDHLDTYADLDEIKEAFVSFVDRVPFFGRAIVCLDETHIQAVLPQMQDRRILTYGLAPQAELSATEVEHRPFGCRFKVRLRERDGITRELGAVDLPMPGEHNARNALAAVAVGLSLDVPFEAIAASLGAFGGVHRRFEKLGSWRGAIVVDDYAHHPTEVAATLEAARRSFAGARIHAIFQPHLYSRTLDHADAFGRALLAADRALVTDIYGSRETPIDGVHSDLVVEAAKASGHHDVAHCADWRDAPDLIAEGIAPGDVVLTLGAGDIYRLAVALTTDGQDDEHRGDP